MDTAYGVWYIFQSGLDAADVLTFQIPTVNKHEVYADSRKTPIGSPELYSHMRRMSFAQGRQKFFMNFRDGKSLRDSGRQESFRILGSVQNFKFCRADGYCVWRLVYIPIGV